MSGEPGEETRGLRPAIGRHWAEAEQTDWAAEQIVVRSGTEGLPFALRSPPTASFS